MQEVSDRAFLDEVMPDGAALLTTAARLTGMSFGASESCVVLDCMNWMAEFTEKDRFSSLGDHAPAWKKDGPHRFDDYWDISARGLEYKNSSEYLTGEGWPLGTKCWFVCVESGWRAFICGETPKLAALRGVIVMATAAKLREIAPDRRPDLCDQLQIEMRDSLA